MNRGDSNNKKYILQDNFKEYTALYKENIHDLFSYGQSLTSNREILKDAIQDIFYKILVNPNSLKDVDNIKYFLFKALKNKLIDIFKAEINQESICKQLDFKVIDVTILDVLIEEEERIEISKRVKYMLEKLTPRQREAIYLRYMHNMEYDEIANLLNMNNPKSARNLVSRAIIQLRKENTELLLFFLISSQLSD